MYDVSRPCEGNGVKINWVSPDSKQWRGVWAGGAYTWPEFQECVRDQIKLHPYRELGEGGEAMKRWPYAITCALLALVLTGCACSAHLDMMGVGVAASEVDNFQREMTIIR